LAAVCAAALVVALPQTGSAQDPCASSANQRQCSTQCCGRWTCPPSCQASCVRACIDACRNPAKSAAFNAQLNDMRRLCGFSSGPAKVAPR